MQKNTIKALLFLVCFLITMNVVSAQTPVNPGPRVQYAPDKIAYPLKGVCRITYTGSQIMKDLEFWVYDANGIEIYYSIQSVPTDDKYAEIIIQIMDREFKEWMTRHGHVLRDCWNQGRRR